MKKIFVFMLSVLIGNLYGQNTYNKLFHENKNLQFINDVKLAYINGDSIMDFILVAHNGSRIYLALMDDDKKPSYTTISEGADIRTIIIHDFNGDGYVDIIGNAPFDDAAYWWENDGNGILSNMILF